jgi:hypothetical protein
MSNSCFQCGEKGENMYGYIICDSCKSKLGLFTDETIKKYISLFKKTKKHSYEKEVQNKLDLLENIYIKKKIKLLSIQERFKQIGK